jgi:hypothetical protein
VPAPAPSPAISLDSYFDRLDAAFTNVSAAPAATSGPPPPAPAAAPAVTDEIDWFGAAKAQTPAPATDLELPVPLAMDERPDLPLSAFARRQPSRKPSARRYRTGRHRRATGPPRKCRTCRSRDSGIARASRRSTVTCR